MEDIIATKTTKPKKAAAASTKPAATKKTAVKKAKPAAPLTAPAKRAPAKKQDAIETQKIHDVVMKSLDQDKGIEIVSIDLKGKTSIADYMVVATGTSSRHVTAMAEKLAEKLRKECGIRSRLEGLENGDWVIVDAFDVIVHIFKPEVREFYNLEKLWGSDFSTIGYNLYTSK